MESESREPTARELGSVGELLSDWMARMLVPETREAAGKSVMEERVGMAVEVAALFQSGSAGALSEVIRVPLSHAVKPSLERAVKRSVLMAAGLEMENGMRRNAPGLPGRDAERLRLRSAGSTASSAPLKIWEIWVGVRAVL